ncbi:MAG: divalent metal cation transporter [Chloroflexota bacterium]|nr:divalent metal cation transporter [Chloroflexota bacterium]
MTTVAAGEPQGPERESSSRRNIIDYFKALGPGMISGASDNDPTTVATISVLGASTVYRLSWLTILLFPMLTVIQVISARIGTVTRRGLQRDVTRRYGRAWGFILLLSVLAVNAVTIAADLEGGAAALGLIFHVAFQWFILPFAIACFALLFFGSYNNIQRILRWVLLVFLAYVISAFLAHPNWSAVLHATVLPSFHFDSTYIQGALALLGTTLTGYAYVWETIEEAEERPPISELGLVQADAGVGMLLAVAVFWFILIGTGATLGIHHKQVQTAQDAAQALAPVAGPIASYLFALGLLASAVLAVPVIVATSAYVLGQEFGFRSSLAGKPKREIRFYSALAGALLVGVIVSFAGVSPIHLLFVSSIIGGLGTPISLAFLLLTAHDRDLMGDHAPGRLLLGTGWLIASVITAVSIYFLWQQFGGLL